MPVPSAMELAASVRQRRLELGLTQAEVAGRIGVRLQTYTRLERSGTTTLTRLISVAEVLGLTLALLSSGVGGVTADPRLARVRRRGLRHARTASPSRPPAAPEAAENPAPKVRRTTAAPAPAPAPTVSAADVARAASEHRDTIKLLVRDIVFNRLTNYNSSNVVRTVMRVKHIDESAKPAFVAAVEGQLQRLDAENIAEYSIDVPHFDLWAKTWKPDLGIIHALD